jgi:murein DD-endopeptidase MepM/ murein hydrolase activator NlpD
VNIMSSISAIERGQAERANGADAESAGTRRASRMQRARPLAIGAGAVAALAALALANAARPSEASPAAVLAAPAPPPEAAALRALAAAAPADHSPAPAEPDSVRLTGKVGADLTQSLRAAGVPDAQGRAYVAALAQAIDLASGLSVEDRFDLVMLRGDGGALGELAFAGLDRVGRSDVELMKWTDGRETRWIDADGLDPSARGMELPVAGRVSSGFGVRFHPILGRTRMHKGVDLAARYGAPIIAAADGRVEAAGWSGGYGRRVMIAHAGGIETLYGHMSRIAAAPGAMVRRGQVIGYVGASGLATGPHLHYEVHLNGRLVNPLTVELTDSPLKGEELHAFRSRLRGLLTGRGGA